MDDLFDSLISAALSPASPAPRKRQAAEPPGASTPGIPVPGPVLRTERLKLRPLEASDAADFHRLINDWDICRKLPDAPFPYPRELADQWIAAAGADRASGQAHQFAIALQSNGKIIGSAGLRVSRDGKTAELGYWIGRKFWRQGYGLEAAARLCAWGLAELRISSVTATVAEDNDASLSVLRRAGFAQTGKGKQAFQCRAGAKLPVLHFAAFREAGKQENTALRETLLVVAAALIDPDGRILLARRPEGKKMAGLWEFPGGKINPNETPEAALVRELREELGIGVDEKNLAPFVFASHPYENFHLLMPVFLCKRWHGKPQPKEGQALAWVEPARLVEYPMPAADRPLIPLLRDFLWGKE
jgi:8-oxo-dGTP diphosphatase